MLQRFQIFHEPILSCLYPCEHDLNEAFARKFKNLFKIMRFQHLSLSSRVG